MSHDGTCPDCGICRENQRCRCCLEVQVQAVRDRHRPSPNGECCVYCYPSPYPCDTIRALDGDR